MIGMVYNRFPQVIIVSEILSMYNKYSTIFIKYITQ